MNTQTLSSIEIYENHLKLTLDWLLSSIDNGKGGSSAHFSPLLGWSKPYPETSGYIIPTLIESSSFLNNPKYELAAKNIGNWLLEIQSDDGSWHGGLHPNSNLKGSVFNTGQILKGMIALYKNTNISDYLIAANNGADWLSKKVDDKGLWPNGDYRASQTPSYYTHVAWPILEVSSNTGSILQEEAAKRFLDNALSRKLLNGAIGGWGFNDSGSAFTHTIAYTIRGFQESSRLIGDYEKYAKPMEQILDFFIRKAELSNGMLAGEFNEDLSESAKYVCLTGNAQLAICILIMEKQNQDLRLVNAAAKLLDFIGSVQSKNHFFKGIKGGIAGSYPIWGRYMFMRYPNWAAKYYCDGLIRLILRLKKEI